MKTILVATHGTTLTITGLTAMFGTPSGGFIGKASNVGMELRPEHIDLVMSDMAEIMASPEYKLWATMPDPKAKTSNLAASTSSTSRSGDVAPSRTRKRTRKPSTASQESTVNGAEANAVAPPHSLTMAEQENALKEAYPPNAITSISHVEKPVKTRVRHRKPAKPRPVVVEESEAVNS